MLDHSRNVTPMVTTVHNSSSIDSLNSVLVLTSSIMSVIGACVIITSFIYLKRVRSTSRCIVAIMAVADIMVALPALIGEIMVLCSSDGQLGDLPCRIQSLFMTSGAQISFIWTAGLAQHMFLLVATRFYVPNRNPGIKYGIVVLLVLSTSVLVENIYLYIDGILGKADVVGIKWCWIKVSSDVYYAKDDCMWMIWDGKLLEIVMYVAVFVYYGCLYAQVKHLRSQNDVNSSYLVSVISKTGKIIAIPIVFVLVRISGTIVTLWLIRNDCIRPSSDVFTTFLTLMYFLDLSQGWINFILYFLTTSREFYLVERVKLAFRSIPLFTKKRRHHSSQNSILTVNTSAQTGRGKSSTNVRNPSTSLVRNPSTSVVRNPSTSIGTPASPPVIAHISQLG